jgi:hypothetical protein
VLKIYQPWSKLPTVKANPAARAANGDESGLPDGVFSYQKYQFECILDRLGMETFGIFYVHLEYFTFIWFILWSFW